jgi:hypothetical protein
LLGGIGIVVLVFAFKLPPGHPPVDVVLTIVAVVAASATLQASVGSTCCCSWRRRSCAAQSEIRIDPRPVHHLHVCCAARGMSCTRWLPII